MSFSTEFFAPLTQTVPFSGPDGRKTKLSTARQYRRVVLAGIDSVPTAPITPGASPAIVGAVSDQRQLPDRNLAMELVRVTEAAALASGRWVGRGDKEGADQSAVDAMRVVLQRVRWTG